MNRREIFKTSVRILKESNCPTPKTDTEIIMSSVLNIKRIEIHTDWFKEVGEKEARKIFEFVERRKRREPIAYITGYKFFYGLKFYIKKGVLIPRPETETLIEAVRKRAKPERILDIGVGSGAILISILHLFKEAEGVGFDISDYAVEVARENTKRIIGNTDRVKIIKGNVFENWENFLDGEFDLIVSNPPYIESPIIESGSLEPEIYFEPRTALDGGEDGMKFYYEIVKQAPKFICKKRNSWIFLEVSDHNAKQVAELLKTIFSNVSVGVLKDLNGKNRVVFAKMQRR